MTTAANKPTESPPLPGAAVRWIGIAIAVAILLWLFPLFRIVPLAETQQQVQKSVFNAEQFVDAFWSGDLADAAASAIDAHSLRRALEADRDAAVAANGHRLGLSGSAAFLVQGEGRVLAISEDTVSLSLDDTDQVGIVIEIGPVFGNAIRDGSGRLDVSNFENTRDFNAISAAINLRVEEQVLPALPLEAKPGLIVRFAGGVELADYDDVTAPLKLVPVSLTFP